ncbi:hypothetical protein, conserved in T. vivax [Trypanosoma vivax Y486]|uniref:Trypanosome variant surface glycoprotein (A-type) n=1 Tax=Trypanosoma vivax (strain Y486) TaxID=1055687 RepID=F9WSG1_TRYVY|nr:hypothetical protein, conserved in T. vivax [Trypanosoma vivax Y486]|eukprot:CCD20500.1 hypothetical protein, conserved in T. vivax [Trypanosoma vivax Y486]
MSVFFFLLACFTLVPLSGAEASTDSIVTEQKASASCELSAYLKGVRKKAISDAFFSLVSCVKVASNHSLLTQRVVAAQRRAHKTNDEQALKIARLASKNVSDFVAESSRSNLRADAQDNVRRASELEGDTATLAGSISGLIETLATHHTGDVNGSLYTGIAGHTASACQPTTNLATTSTLNSKGLEKLPLMQANTTDTDAEQLKVKAQAATRPVFDGTSNTVAAIATKTHAHGFSFFRTDRSGDGNTAMFKENSATPNGRFAGTWEMAAGTSKGVKLMLEGSAGAANENVTTAETDYCVASLIERLEQLESNTDPMLCR